MKKLFVLFTAFAMLTACKEKTTNIFLQEWDTPYGTAPFSKITADQYLPAFKAGLEEQKANIAAIIANEEAPTFENTILAYEQASPILDKVSGVFFNLTESESTPEMQAIDKNDFSQMIFFKKRHFSCKKKHRYSLPWKIYLSILARKIVLFLLLLCTLN